MRFHDITRTVMRAGLTMAVLAGCPVMASATQYTLDLRGSEFAPVGPTDTWTANAGIPGYDLTVTVHSNMGTLTHDPTLGYGVNSTAGYAFDEVEGDERIIFEFSKPTFVVAVGVMNFFFETQGAGTCPGDAGCYFERGEVMFNDNGSWSMLSASGFNNNAGYDQYAVIRKDVTKVEFRFPGLLNLPGFGYPQFHEAAIRNFVLQSPEPPIPAPEPTTLMAVATGLVGLVGTGGRRKR